MIDGSADRRTVRQLVDEGTAALAHAGVEEPRRESRLLLAHAAGSSTDRLLAHPHAAVAAGDARVFQALVRRRALREPLAYLVGARAWLDFTLLVNRNVLIPRPETELLAGMAIEAARASAVTSAGGGTRLCIADVGTGSGAIAVSVARALPSARVVATDISAGALRTAARNSHNLAGGRVELFQTDLLDGLEVRADIVVANLPYIPTLEVRRLDPELQFEPVTALDGGADGLDPFRALFTRAGPYLGHDAHILLE